MGRQCILILDFGAQYNQLIARRIREFHVYCEVLPGDTPIEELRARGPSGLLLTGGPESVCDPQAPRVSPEIYTLGVPIFGICYGCQLMARDLGGTVVHATEGREFGRTETVMETHAPLFQGLPEKSITWMSHSDHIEAVPEGFAILAHSDGCPVAAMGDAQRRFYGVQFHPEVMHTRYGRDILYNFLYRVCRATGDWTMRSFLDKSVAQIQERVGDRRVLLALSGGVDSAVCAGLISRAIGERLTCVFVDNGLLRKGEGDEVESAVQSMPLHFVRVNAQDFFLEALHNVSDPEEKRRRIGEAFIRVFEREARALGQIDILAQGTIYPDVIESGAGRAAGIKSHHNVGGLPDVMAFQEILEPLRSLFKDEVRQLGRQLGLPTPLIDRQPFPGPGLAVRVIGPVTQEKLDCLRQADAIFREEIEAAGWERSMSQYFAVLTDTHTVGVMGDSRAYRHVVALRAVATDDFMTADYVRIPWEILEKVSIRIVNEVPLIGRVVYDITSKPPATIEWE